MTPTKAPTMLRPRPSVLFRSARMLCSLALLGGALSACGEQQVTCGAGTTLDETSHECLPLGDLNVIVDDFALGKFKMTNVDVPERLDVGTPDTRTFTITNSGTTKRDVVAIRYGIVPVTARIEELREKLAEVDDQSELDVTFVGQVMIDNLEPGETREVSYEYSVPNTVENGLYGLYFSLDEVPLIKGDDGQYIVDFRQPGIAKEEGSVRLDDAALVFAPATVIVGKPDQPNLRVLSAKLDNASFELDNSEEGSQQMFTMSARMSAQALNVTEPVTASFELRLPGHVVDVAGQDLGRGAFESDAAFEQAAPLTTYRYDAARKFPLYIQQTDGVVASKEYAPKCVSHDETNDETGEIVTTQDCAVIFNEEGRDDVYQLHLAPEAVRLLELTRAHATLNEALNVDGEIPGQLELKISTTQAEYQNNLADNVKTFDIVFMAPAPAPAATETDTDNAGVTELQNGYGDSGPYPYVLSENVSSQGFGNEWFGAGYRFETNASYNKHRGATIAQYKRSSHNLTATFLKMNNTIIGASGELDWGTDKGLPSYKAKGSLIVFGYTLLNATFDPAFCTTSSNLTLCPIFEANAESVSRDGAPVTPKKKGREFSKSWEIRFQAGPVPLLIKADAGIAGGLKVAGQFAIDRSGMVPKYGVQFSMGPWAALEVTVFGGVSVGVARAGVEGNIQLMSADFLPTLRPTAGVLFDTAAGCFKAADTSLAFEGPFTIRGPNGNVGVVAYAGFRVCFFGRCVKGEKKVFSFTIASFSTFEKTWYAWKMEPRWRRMPGEEGMCSQTVDLGPAAAWRSPTSCSNSYCAGSSTNRPGMGETLPERVLPGYQSKYTLSGIDARCVDVKVSGTTRKEKDRVIIYDHTGKPVNMESVKTCFRPYLCFNMPQFGWSGAINQTQRVCSPSVTAALESSNGSVVGYPGVTVSFTPSL